MRLAQNKRSFIREIQCGCFSFLCSKIYPYIKISKCLHHHAELKLYTVAQLEILVKLVLQHFKISTLIMTENVKCFVYLNDF